MTVKVELHGLEDVKRDLKRLSEDLRRKALRSGVRSISTVVKKEAQANAPFVEGRLRFNVVLRFWRSRDRRHQFYAIRVMEKGKRGDPRNAFYWRFVEHGHNDRSGAFVPGQGFFTRTYDWLRRNIDGLTRKHMRAGIDRTVKAASRK